MARLVALVTLPIMAGLLTDPLVHAQSAAKRPQFEVASIKLNPSCDSRAGGSTNSPDRWGMKCRPLRWYIEGAYAAWDGPHLRWPRPEVLGGPRWVDSDMYDIFAKAEQATPYWQKASLMLQALLEERFKLRVHTEARDTSVYLLTLVRNDPRLKRLPEDGCTSIDMDNPQDRPSPRALFESPKKPCGSGRFQPQGVDTIADWYGVSMADFASNGLSGRVGRHVVDKTGLTGLFDIHLEFSNDTLSASVGPDAPSATAVPTKPTIVRALQDQLGLKLTAARAPVEVIVIDRAERPSEN